MTKFNVVLEIELNANSPLEAAMLARQWASDDPMQYYVQNVSTREIVSVDLLEFNEDAVLPVKEYKPLIS